jgi:hypothetical protein
LQYAYCLFSGLLEVYEENVPLQLAQLLNIFRETASSFSDTGRKLFSELPVLKYLEKGKRKTY